MVRDVLILGNKILREKSTVITDFENKGLKNEITDLKDTLENFRKVNGFGRGIAAVQIGITKRIVALNLVKETFVIINPEITFKDNDTFTMWDDCMSFPDLLVKVKRHKMISINYQDESGNTMKWNNIGQAESELLQHEIDHLDGILAVDRALDNKDIIYKSEYLRNREYYDSLVDYVIKPAIKLQQK